MMKMTYDSAASRTGVGRRHPVQLAAAAVGGVFLLVGILGFVPGVTANYDQLSLAGHESGALLLGVFAVSVLHNLVHAAFGVAGLVLSRTRSGAKNYLVVGGIVYAVLWLYGLLIDHGSTANFVPVNNADNWLHLVLALGMIALGVLLTRDTRNRTTG
jgi:arginine exporter protein ArgO